MRDFLGGIRFSVTGRRHGTSLDACDSGGEEGRYVRAQGDLGCVVDEHQGLVEVAQKQDGGTRSYHG